MPELFGKLRKISYICIIVLVRRVNLRADTSVFHHTYMITTIQTQ